MSSRSETMPVEVRSVNSCSCIWNLSVNLKEQTGFTWIWIWPMKVWNSWYISTSLHPSEYLWFICCPKIFDYFGVEKCILNWAGLIHFHIPLPLHKRVLSWFYSNGCLPLSSRLLVKHFPWTLSIQNLLLRSLPSWSLVLWGLDPKDLRHLQFEIAL